MRVCACKSGQLTPPRMQGLLPLGMAAHPSAAKVKHFLKKLLTFCVGGVHMLGWAWPFCVRVTFIVLHAHTSVLVHHFRTWPYMRTRAFLAVSLITNYRLYIYIYIYIYDS